MLGVVFVRFTVTKAGTVRDIRVVKGLTDPTNSAVVAAVHRLPWLEPGLAPERGFNATHLPA